MLRDTRVVRTITDKSLNEKDKPPIHHQTKRQITNTPATRQISSTPANHQHANNSPNLQQLTKITGYHLAPATVSPNAPGY